MFTGIIDHSGEIASIEVLADRVTLSINSTFENFVLGESIAIDGVCVTVSQKYSQGFSCDLSPETLARTKAIHYKVGDRVNLERALRLSDRVGGHFVLGHVDETAVLVSKEKQAEFVQMCFAGISKSSQIYLIEKGSIAVNGVSLTLNTVGESTFSIMLIPHTLKRTNLSHLKSDELVNIEFDLLTKTIVKTTREIIDAKTV